MSDRAKLDEYLESVRQTERRVQAAERAAARIAEPPFAQPAGIPQRRDEYLRLMGDLIVHAFRLDLTRVATLLVDPERWDSPRMFDGVFDSPQNHHVLTHTKGDEAKEKITEIDRFHVDLYAYVVKRLASIPEGDETLLDHCCIVMGSGISDGDKHNYADLQVLLAGGLVKRTGFKQYSGRRPLADLWLTLARRRAWTSIVSPTAPEFWKMSCRRFCRALVVLLLACAYIKTPAAADDAAFFREYIEPLLENNCYDCHSHDAGEAGGGLVLDSKAGWSVGGNSGPTVVPGKLEKSLLWRVVKYDEPGLEMPPDGKLPASDLVLIKRWIESGAVDPREGGKAADKKRIDIETGRQWWAFQPLRTTGPQTAPKQANDHASSGEAGSNRIDWFIDKRLRNAGLSAAPPADRQTLLRRVAYDVTGLPPDAALVTAGDPLDRQTYTDFIDTLLASDAFGEKWGRHWLDIARYADSNGSSFNVPFHNAWRYRNWVIDAINRNMPVDEFIRKQIAGDLLPAKSVQERDENFIATGYLLLGSKVLGTFDKEQLTLDVIDEQVDTIGKSLLGMTLGCARCHDHKFDPLPQADYYALAGILASTSTLVDRIGGPKDDESDWQRRGLGPDGDQRLVAFLEEHRYDWVRAVRNRFNARKKFDELKQKSLLAAPAEQVGVEDDRSSVRDALAEAELKLREADETLRKLLADMPSHAMAVREAEEIRDLEIRIRGVASSKGDLVPRGFLQVAAIPDQPKVPANQSGRLELAQWITSPDNPLTSRVFVNRVWSHLFRQGLVRSVDNFGTTGDRPSHPELLDDLAIRFIANGWNLKQLIREVVLSDAYQRAVPRPHSEDPENRLLAHQNRRRLQAEEIRDTLLTLGGRLQRGPNEHVLQSLPIGDASNLGEYLDIHDNRRTVYQPVIRTLEPRVLQLFNAAGNTMVTGARPKTIVAPQSLYFLNSQFVQASAETIGCNLLSKFTGPSRQSLGPNEYDGVLDDLVTDIFQTIIARTPTQQEMKLLKQYVRAQADGEPGLTSHDMLKVCQAVIGSTQFQYLE